MNSTKYVVACKKGCFFFSSKEKIKEFIEENGKYIAYYIGYYKPIENLDFLTNTNANLKDSSDVSC